MAGKKKRSLSVREAEPLFGIVHSRYFHRFLQSAPECAVPDGGRNHPYERQCSRMLLPIAGQGWSFRRCSCRQWLQLPFLFAAADSQFPFEWSKICSWKSSPLGCIVSRESSVCKPLRGIRLMKMERNIPGGGLLLFISFYKDVLTARRTGQSVSPRICFPQNAISQRISPPPSK